MYGPTHPLPPPPSLSHTHTHTHTHSLQKENASLKEKLVAQEQDYQQAVGKIQAHHEERIVKMREQYVDLTASLLNNMKDRDAGGGGGGASPKPK